MPTNRPPMIARGTVSGPAVNASCAGDGDGDDVGGGHRQRFAVHAGTCRLVTNQVEPGAYFATLASSKPGSARFARAIVSARAA